MSSPEEPEVDFAGYSDEQLEELKNQIDPRTSPGRYSQLLVELDRRQAPRADAISWWSGRFTVHDGIWGWLEALRTRTPFFGEGMIGYGRAGLALQGWRRTWLGVAHRDEERLALDRVRNVTWHDRRVEFSYERSYGLSSRVYFTASSQAEARKLAETLPTATTADSQQQLSELREFKARLVAVSPRAWITPILVLLNVAMFAAMAVSARRLGGFDLVTVLSWGGNLGTMTVNGQWWRLVTALFVHLNLLHLVLNLWVLWNVGRLAERLYGMGAFLFLYFASGVLGNLTSIAWEPSNTTAGASGAIFGILGAQLVFLVHRESRIPAQVARAHWLSTLVFVLFNLLHGAFTPGIDNAAHVGGLFGGAALGWILVRPLEANARQEFPFHKAVAATLLLGAAVLLGIVQVTGLGSQLTVPERYARAHLWYFKGEAENLAAWNAFASQSASGSLSDAELGARFEQQIVPFWVMADERLKKEAGSLPPEEKAYAALVTDYTQLRLAWGRAIARAATNRDQSALNESIRLLRETDIALARIERVQLRASMDHRPRALDESAFVARLRSLFGQRRGCVRRPLAYGPSVAATDARNDAPAMRDDIGCRTQGQFMSGDYAELDRRMTDAVRSLKDLPDGSSSLQAIVSGLSTLFEFGGLDLSRALARTAGWRRTVPASVNADLVESMIFSDWAWGARGHGAANEVSQQAWALFAHRTEMAAAGLRDLEQRGSEQPLWYELAITTALDQSRDAAALRAIFDRGAAKFPEYLPLYRGMLRALMPRWGGSYENVDRFINDMSLPTHDFARYASLYWMYDALENGDVNIFVDALARWSTMKSGLIVMSSHHPASDFVANGFARFACLGNDVQQYTQLRLRVKQHYSATAWSAKVNVDTCDKKFGLAARAFSPRPDVPQTWLGTWYSESGNDEQHLIDGRKYDNRRELIVNQGDGTRTDTFRYYDKAQLVGERISNSSWGVDDGEFWTQCLSLVKDGDAFPCSVQYKYEIISASSQEIRYKSTQTQNTYTLTRVADDFRLP